MDSEVEVILNQLSLALELHGFSWRSCPLSRVKMSVYSRPSEIRKGQSRRAENYPEKVSNDTLQCIQG